MKKAMSIILSVCLLMTLSVTSFAASEDAHNHSADIHASAAAHTCKFVVTSTYTSKDPCFKTYGEHTGTWAIKECSICGQVVHTNTKNSCGSCPTGGSMR